MCCLLASMVACSLVPCTSREWSHDIWSTTAWITLTATPKQAATFCRISNLYNELHQEGLVWSLGFASDLELARWGAVHPAKSLVA
jgi:hypothetical protein